jgi:AcrR family transcriptional regulator
MSAQASERRRQIIDLATDLFSRDGYGRVTMRQIAEACGVTEAALYKHYESKAAIYTAVLESLEDRLAHEDIFEKLSGEDDVELILRGMAGHILSFFGANQDIYRLLLFSALEGHERARHVFKTIRGRYMTFLLGRLDDLHEKRLIIEKNNEITARCFVGMVFDCALGFSLWKGMQGKMYEPDQVINNNIPIYVRGLKHADTPDGG